MFQLWLEVSASLQFQFNWKFFTEGFFTSFARSMNKRTNKNLLPIVSILTSSAYWLKTSRLMLRGLKSETSKEPIVSKRLFQFSCFLFRTLKQESNFSRLCFETVKTIKVFESLLRNNETSINYFLILFRNQNVMILFLCFISNLWLNSTVNCWKLKLQARCLKLKLEDSQRAGRAVLHPWIEFGKKGKYLCADQFSISYLFFVDKITEMDELGNISLVITLFEWGLDAISLWS